MTGEAETTTPSRLAIFRNRNFRYLWIGSTVSNFGDQFYIIALPWLVLMVTGDNALALGSIMAAGGIPRAILMVLGGAVMGKDPTERAEPWRLRGRSLLPTCVLYSGPAASSSA